MLIAFQGWTELNWTEQISERNHAPVTPSTVMARPNQAQRAHWWTARTQIRPFLDRVLKDGRFFFPVLLVTILNPSYNFSSAFQSWVKLRECSRQWSSVSSSLMDEIVTSINYTTNIQLRLEIVTDTQTVTSKWSRETALEIERMNQWIQIFLKQKVEI